MKTNAYSASGCELSLLGFAAGSDRDSVWALRKNDCALRCYYLHQVRLPDGVAHISAVLSSLKPLSKSEAMALCPVGTHSL
jgi:hypothetical protein